MHKNGLHSIRARVRSVRIVSSPPSEANKRFRNGNSRFIYPASFPFRERIVAGAVEIAGGLRGQIRGTGAGTALNYPRNISRTQFTSPLVPVSRMSLLTPLEQSAVRIAPGAGERRGDNAKVSLESFRVNSYPRLARDQLGLSARFLYSASREARELDGECLSRCRS